MGKGPFFVNRSLFLAGCPGIVQAKGFIKNFQQLYILFGHHHAVSADGIEQYTQPGFG